MTYEEAKRILHPDTTREALAEIEFLGGFRGKQKSREAVDEACIMACEALDKQIPDRHFQNECGCIVDYSVLRRAIDKKCKSKNCYLHDCYRIVVRNGYPSVCIDRQWIRVHVLIGEYLYGYIRKGYVVHHKDRNKLNAMPENLTVMSNQRHAKIHGEERKGTDLRTPDGKERGIKAAAEARKRKDVTETIVRSMRGDGKTMEAIAQELNCGVNTLYRRLGMQS